MADNSDISRNYKEFVDLLPLTLTLAGLPPSSQGIYFTEDQIAARSFTIKHAYRAARSLMRDCVIPKDASPR
ncbi:MAG: hypothetical protein ACK5V1_04310 [Planctomycetaceae bacterium]|jgi:hypothetical protein